MPPRLVAISAPCSHSRTRRGADLRVRVRASVHSRGLLAAGLLLLSACGDGTGPDTRRVQLAPAGGERQFGAAGAELERPLQVVVTDPADQRPLDDVDVTWRIVSGNGTLSAARTTTDDIGVASVELRLGNAGEVRVEADADGNIGEAVAFQAQVVAPPIILSVTPLTIAPGETVTISGQGFLPASGDNAVLFGGIRGTVESASETQLVVTAPSCLQSRSVDLRVYLGQVPSAPFEVHTVAPAGGGLDVEVGEVVRFAGEQVGCIRFEDPHDGAVYLLVPQNASEVVGLPVDIELVGRVGPGPPITLPEERSDLSWAADWELALRARERALLGAASGPGNALLPQAAPPAQEPRIGDRRDFNVLNSEEESERVTAEVRAISTRAVMYVDLAAPANGFTPEDLAGFGMLFDDPIYSTDVALFGTPTDVDANGRIIILFTPRVNALTERGAEGFVAGYFYGCDLVDASRCADTNRAEIFYSMVPDPQGQFGDARSRVLVQRTVPGILAHEFQHMIHFGQKGSLDALWLSEGLAHAAEDIVGRIFQQRGQTATAADFRNPNFGRANRYLANVSDVSLVGEDSPGTLELRGGAWLLVEHLAGVFGETVLGELTRTTRTGVDNVEAATGEPWARLLSDFAVALWADENPDLSGVSIDPRFTFARLDLRSQIGMFQGGFPLQPVSVPFADFQFAGSLASAAHDYLLLRDLLPGDPLPLSLTFAGLRGGPFAAAARPQLTLLRVR